MPLSGILHTANIARAEMVHFVVNLHGYLMLEALEGSWTELLAMTEKADNLDALIAAHDQFLAQLRERALTGGKRTTVNNTVSNTVGTVRKRCQRVMAEREGFLVKISTFAQ